MDDVRPAGALSTLHRVLFERDHTEGSLLASIAVLALPALAMGLAGGAGFQIVELWLVGHLGPGGHRGVRRRVASARPGAVPGRASASPSLRRCWSRSSSARGVPRTPNASRARRSCSRSESASGSRSIGQFPHALLGLLTRDADVIAAGAPFVRVAYGFMFAQIFGMLFSFVLSGAGETTTPLLLSLISTPLTLAARVRAGAGALRRAGARPGRARDRRRHASLLSLSIALFLLLTGRCRLHLRPRHFAPDARLLVHIASRAWQPALHMIVPTLMMVAYMTISGRYGTDVQAAYTIGLRIESLPVFLSFPIANACATLVGQNLGAGRPVRAWRAIGAGYALELAATSVIAIVLFLARERIVGFFSQDPEVIRLASEYLLFACANVVLIGTYFVSFRALQGAGDMLSPMLASIAAALGVAVPLAFWLTNHTDLGPRALWIANLAFSATNATLVTGWLALGRWARPRAVA